MKKVIEKISPYFKLMRFQFHLSFITVVFAALYYANAINLPLLTTLLACYAIFNVLLYGGLYTFNDIIDRKADAAHPLKRLRSIPSGKVSLHAALLFSLSLISVAMLLAYWVLSSTIFWILVAFIVLNLAYTLVFKRMVFVNLTLIAATHTLRFVLGATLAGVAIGSHHWLVFALFYITMYGIAVTVHHRFNLPAREKPYYTKSRVAWIQLVCLLIPGSYLLASAANITSLGFTSDLSVVLMFAVLASLVLTSRIERFKPLLARIFMITTNKKTT